MVKALCSLLLILGTLNSSAQSGKKFITKLHKTYAGKWMNSFSFQQNTSVYRNDSLIRKEVWTEAIQYPDLFRMDFGDVKNGNGMLFVGDSSFRFSKSKLVKAAKQENDLIFLLGGMYFYSKDSAILKLQSLNYDLNRSYSTTWQGKKVTVVGASNAEEKVNQLWFENDRKVLVRMFKYEDGSKQEIHFDKHVNLFGKGWTETFVKIFINDKLIQEEEYFNLKANPKLVPDTFNPLKFVEATN